MSNVFRPAGTVVYIMKYAMTTGVVRTILSEALEDSSPYAYVRFDGTFGRRSVFSVRDLAWSENEAREKMEALRTRKLSSLAKASKAAIAKKFVVVDQVP